MNDFIETICFPLLIILQCFISFIPSTTNRIVRPHPLSFLFVKDASDGSESVWSEIKILIPLTPPLPPPPEDT